MASGEPLRISGRAVHPAHAGGGGKRHEARAQFVQVPAAQAETLLGQHHDGAALGRLIGQGGQLGSVGQLGRIDIRRGQEGRGLAVAQGDGAGLVQKQHVHIAGGLHGPAGHCDDVGRNQPVHAGDADGRQQPADGGGGQTDEKRRQHRDRDDRALAGLVHGKGGVRIKRHAHHEENKRQGGEQDVERDLVGGLAALGALHQGDHAVEEGLAGFGRDPDHQPVREHAGAAGDGRAVAAGLPDDRSRFAGDGRFVHRGDAVQDLAVAGDGIPGFHQKQVPPLQGGRGHDGGRPHAGGGGPRFCRGVPLGPAQGIGVGLAPALGHGLGEVGESTVNHSQQAMAPVKPGEASPCPKRDWRKRTVVRRLPT
jgi:hypothetical protein